MNHTECVSIRMPENEINPAKPEKSIVYIQDNDNVQNSSRHSPRTKATGVKSILTVSEDTLLIASFGNHNTMIADKVIEKGVVTELQTDSVLSVVCSEVRDELHITGLLKEEISVLNPLSKQERKNDLINARGLLEKQFFGKVFQDNIHIQLIYNILDIEKIIGLYIGNVAYEIRNVFHLSNDLIGILNLHHDWKQFSSAKEEEKYQIFMRLQGSDKKGYFEMALKEDCAHNYAVLFLLGVVRQAMAHGDVKTRTDIYILEEKGRKRNEYAEALAVMKDMYHTAVKAINNQFLPKESGDFGILLEAYGGVSLDSKRKLAEEYYDFAIGQDYKSCGISIKYLRNLILETYVRQFIDGKQKEYRFRASRAIDFSIWRYYKEHHEELKKVSHELRACLTDTEKERIYKDQVSHIWPEIEGVVKEHYLHTLCNSWISYHKNTLIDKSISQVKPVPDTAHPFCMLMYVISTFLDPHEINQFLSALIQKFSQIAGMLKMMQECKLNDALRPEYGMFLSSDLIAKELCIVRSISRMYYRYIEPTHRGQMYEDAKIVLGIENSTSNRLYGTVLKWRMIRRDEFRKIVRYGSIKHLQQVMRVENLVRFSLSCLKQEEVLEWHRLCCDDPVDDSGKAIEKLVQMLINLRMDQTYVSKDRRVTRTAQYKIQLYLKLLGNIMSELMQINSRYFIAFHCLERDAVLFNNADISYDDLRDHMTDFAKQHVQRYSSNEYAKKYLMSNFSNADDGVVRYYRNCVMHHNALTDISFYVSEIGEIHSWFELYHYIVQNYLAAQIEEGTRRGKTYNNKTYQYIRWLNRHHTYCKDFLKALNIAFAYNLPRYKNLSIEGLFDRNNMCPMSDNWMMATGPEAYD